MNKTTRLHIAITSAMAAALPALAIELVGVPSNTTVECGSVPAAASVSATGGCSSLSSVGMVLHYDFEVDGTNEVDLSGSGNDGTVFGGTRTNDPARGHVMRFDGNDYLRVGQMSQVNGAASLSFGGWIKPTGSGSFGIVGKTLAGNETFGLAVGGPTAVISANIRTLATQFLVSEANGKLTYDEWQHVMAVYDGRALQVYHNGLLQSAVTGSAVSAVSSNSVVAAVGDFAEGRGWYFKGEMDDVRVYTRALSGTEVNALASGATSHTVTLSEATNGTCPAVITRVWTATDGCGDSVSATQVITVVAPPEPLQLVGVPSNTTVDCGAVPGPALVTVSGGCSALVAPTGRVLYAGNGHYYQLMHSNASWSAVRTASQIAWGGLTGHLATVTDADENAFVSGLLPTQSIARIGGFENASNGWIWITGEPWNYTNWAAGDPGPGEDSLRILSDGWLPSLDGKWQDGHDSPGEWHGDYFVVEWDGTPTLAAQSVEFSETTNGGCPGAITRVWTATDGCGASVSATQVITVVAPPEPLQLVGVPSNITVECGSVPVAAAVTATGGCSEVSAEGLVLHYAFEQDSVTEADLSGSGNDGVVLSAVLTNDPIRGNARYFDQNDYIQVGQFPQVNGTAALSFGGWVKPTGSGSFGVIGKTLAGNGTFGLAVGGPAAVITANIETKSGQFLVSDAIGKLAYDEWQHVMAVYDGRILSVYRDGALAGCVTGSTVSAVASNSVVATVGDFAEGRGWLFKGTLDDIRVYTRALSGDEVNALARDSGRPSIRFSEMTDGTCPSVIARVWTATDGCGSSVSATQVITVLAPAEPLHLVGVPSNTTVDCDSVPEPPIVTAVSPCADTNLLLCYKFDAPGSLVLDCSMYARHGTNVGSTWDSEGWSGGGYLFDNTNDYIRTADWGFPVEDAPRTMSMWIQPHEVFSEGGSDFFSYGRQTNNSCYYYGIDWHTGRQQFAFSPWGAVVLATTKVSVASNWMHIAHVYRGNNVHEWYVNGKSCRGLRETTGSLNTVLSGLVRIGEHPFSAHGFRGRMDDIRLYSRAVDATEIDGIMAGDITVPVTYLSTTNGTCPAIITRVWTATDGCGSSVSATQVITVVAPPEPLQLVGIPSNRTVECGSVPAATGVTMTGGCSGVSSEGLVLHYAFEQGGSAEADLSGSGNDGVNIGAVLTNDALRGNARYFDGNDYIKVGQLPQANGATALSFGGWIKPTGAGSLGVIGKTLAANETFGLAVGGPTAVITANVRGSNEFLVADANGVLQYDVWQHVMAVFDGKTLRVFRNGALAGSRTGSVSSIVASNTVVAAVGDFAVGRGWFFKGALDDIRVYARALSEAEVYALAQGAGGRSLVVRERINGSCPTVIERVWTATDGCGASVSATQLIESVDTVPPILRHVPTSTVMYCGSDIPAATVTAWDACSGLLDVDEFTVSSGACPRFVTRTWTSVDHCGNTAVATQTISVVSDTRDSDGDGLSNEQERALGTDPNRADTDGDGRGDGVEVNTKTDPLSPSSYPALVRNDFDGDRKSDVAVFANGSAYWYLLQSRLGRRDVQFGFNGVRPFTGDFDNDGSADIAVHDSSKGTWYWMSVRRNIMQVVYRGHEGATGFTGDFDGDDKTDFGAYDPRLGLLSIESPGFSTYPPRRVSPFASLVVADFDGDGRDDVGVYQAPVGLWTLVQYSGTRTVRLGSLGWLPHAADIDGDKKADLCVYSRATGQWRIRVASGAIKTRVTAPGGVPVVGDYDGDGVDDLASYVARTGRWTILRSRDGKTVVGWGFGGTVPVGAAP